MMKEITDILDFWFGTLDIHGMPTEETRMNWFKKSNSFDAQIKQQFGVAITAASTGEYDGWVNDPHGALALIILLDQFRRNVYRNTPEAFSLDAKALSIAQQAVDLHYDQALLPIQRVFVYLPFEHSEQLNIQQKSVELFEALYESVPASQQTTFNGFYEFAKKHQAVIQQFGEFPHRNTILERESTPAELEYLAQGGGF